MLSMLVAFDAAGDVVAQLDYMVRYAEDGTPLGVLDFEAHEQTGGQLRDVWNVSTAVGSATWPEWLGPAALHFRVELDGPPGQKRITALVHKVSGHRRERGALEQAIRETTANEDGERDLRAVLGGPNRPLPLDETGRTRPVDGPRRLPDVPLAGRRP
jgi:hypothetical protein